MAVSEQNQRLRNYCRQIFAAGIRAVDPVMVVQRPLQRDGQRLFLAGRRYDLTRYQRLFVVGMGKASATMAVGLVFTLTASMARQRPSEPEFRLRDFQNTIYSQAGEDGILQKLFEGIESLLRIPVEGIVLGDDLEGVFVFS